MIDLDSLAEDLYKDDQDYSPEAQRKLSEELDRRLKENAARYKPATDADLDSQLDDITWI